MRYLILAGLFKLMILTLIPTTAFANTRVLVIPKGSTATFWEIVGQGALQAGKELGISVTIRGPHSEDKRQAQINIVEYGIKQKFDAIVLAPNHVDKTAPALKRAVATGIKVVLIDSAMTSAYHSSFIESDNYRAGQVAAEHIASMVEGSGKVILARHIKGHASTFQREKGFMDTITSTYPDIHVVADPYVGRSTGEAYHFFSDLLRKLTGIEAIFAVNEETTIGILRAIKSREFQPKIKFMGFDFNPAIRSALLDNIMSATIVQNPFHMGYLGVKTAVQLTRNEQVPSKINTGLIMVTRENINSAEVKKVTRLGMLNK